MTEPLDTCRICLSACTYCADKRAAAKLRHELEALGQLAEAHELPPSVLRVPLGEFIAKPSK